jgi:hypothetical protein
LTRCTCALRANGACSTRPPFITPKIFCVSSGVARAGERLQGRHDDRFEPEARVERRERHGDHDRRAVRVGDDVAARTILRALRVEQRQVRVVDFGDEQRHVLVHPVGGRVADDRKARARELPFGLARHPARQARKHEVTAKRRLRRFDPQRARVLRHLARQTPRASLRVKFVPRAIRRRQRRHLELRVVCEQLNEPLPDRPRRT